MRYSTKQRKILLETLEHHRDETLCVDQIITYMGDDTISRSSVYRNLSGLEAQGRVRRVAVPGEGRTMYCYTGAGSCREHLHLECSKCGRIYHLDGASTNTLVENVMRSFNFRVDNNTVLYGVCEKCQEH